jgi:hypothetical protein
MQCRGKKWGLTILSNAILFSSHLGKPSIRTLLALLVSIAFLMSSTVISDGTILPSLMMSRINSLKCNRETLLQREGVQRLTGGDHMTRHYYPFSLPDAISWRRMSPALKWVNPKSEAILVHCVPLPLPGPPIGRNWIMWLYSISNQPELNLK